MHTAPHSWLAVVVICGVLSVFSGCSTTGSDHSDADVVSDSADLFTSGDVRDSDTAGCDADCDAGDSTDTGLTDAVEVAGEVAVEIYVRDTWHEDFFREYSLCFPCKQDQNCQGDRGGYGNLCLDRGANGKVCGVFCSRDWPCRQGYECLSSGVGGEYDMQCQPADGAECPCTTMMITDGARTDCVVKNEFGECFGDRACNEDCSASVPAPETCNLKDDDCNGATDDGLGFTQCGVGICEHTVGHCVNGNQYICDPFAGAVDETCNGNDDDCDGETDEDIVCL